MKKILMLMLCTFVSVSCLYGCGKEEKKEKGDVVVVDAEEKVEQGADADHAIEIRFNKKVRNNVKDIIWYSFKTGKNDEMTYRITVVNTKGKGCADFELLDEFGEGYGSSSAQDNGSPATIEVFGLEANTEYFIGIVNNSMDTKSVDFSLIVKAKAE